MNNKIILYAYLDDNLNVAVADSETFPLRLESCSRACSPSDWYQEGKCGRNGCYHSSTDKPCLAILTPKTK